MDMWASYIAATREKVPDADEKIVFDTFHIAKHLGDAVDPVRRRENRERASQGSDRLEVVRAWAIKEAAMLLWGHVRRGWAERMWMKWYAWAIRSRREPIKRVARMIKKHWQGVMNAATTAVTNARAEAINSRIRWVKRMARGFRNRANFRAAICFHLSGLDLYPEALESAHSKV